MTQSAAHGRTCSSLFHLLQDLKREGMATDRAILFNDYEQICKRVKTRGVGILLVDLPKLGKLFDKSLSNRFFLRGEVPQGLRLKGNRFLFDSLIYRLFRRNGELIEPADPTEVFFTRCVLYHYKKVEMECSDEAKAVAMDEFISIDAGIEHSASCDWWTPDLLSRFPQLGKLSFADGIPTGRDGFDDERDRLSWLDYVARLTVPQSVYIDWDDFKPKHGPGAVSDLPSSGDKYVFPSWPERLARVFPSNGWASHMHDCHEDSLPESWGEQDNHAKVICVPKTYDKPRVIASEPTAHMYCQQAIMQYLRSSMTNLTNNMISFSSQEMSRRLALQASIDGSYATIDLSSASDRMSLWAVERLFKTCPDLLDALKATRSAYAQVREERILLRKFAAMGSAVTFPVQSILYATVALAACTYRKDWRSSPPSYREIEAASKDIRVFGDDIICPTKYSHHVIDLLTLVGMQVNYSKTHTRGLFRESCGMDAYAGVDVTPLYASAFELRHGLGTWLVSWCEVSNNAYRKGLWNLSNWMDSCIPKLTLRKIPITSRPMPCVHLFTYIRSTESLPLTRRWNVDLQHTQHKTICVESRLKVKGRNAWPDLLQYFIEGSRDHNWFLDPALTRVGHRTEYRTRVVVRWVSLSRE